MRSLLFLCHALSVLFLPRVEAAIHVAQGTMVGEVNTTSAILHCRLTSTQKKIGFDVPGSAGVGRFEYSEKKDFSDSTTTEWLVAKPEYDYILKTKITGLRPYTRYHYRVVFGSDRDKTTKSDSATFRTLPGKDSDQAVSFVVVTGMNYMSFHHGILRKGKRNGERAYQGLDKHLGFPGLSAMQHLKPDFFVGTGDNVYYDSHDAEEATDVTGMRRKWHQQFAQTRFIEFFRETPTYWEKDDHDHRYNDCDRVGSRPPSSDLGIRIFREQVPVVDPTDPQAKTYRTFRINKHLQIWLVEGRDYRSPNKMDDGPDKTLWGTEQIAWLKQTLLASDATYKLLISPTPMVGPDDAYKRDNHTNHKGFRTEGRAFFKWIKDRGLDKRGFHIICGDRHWQYHSVDPTGIEEFSSGALVDSNSRLGRNPGDPKSTDPNAEINQFYTQEEASGGFLRVSVNETASAQFEFYDENGELLHRNTKSPNIIRSAVGVTRAGTPIFSIHDKDDFDHTTKKKRILLIAGLDGDKASQAKVLDLVHEYSLRPEFRKRILLSAIPLANPDKQSELPFPPPSKSYNDPKTDTFQYLWRWIGMHAPDLVVCIGGNDQASGPTLETRFADALTKSEVCDVGSIPALAIATGKNDVLIDAILTSQLKEIPIFERLNPPGFIEGPSLARQELIRRINRSPLEIATQLASHYGHSLKRVMYQPALAVVARMRLGQMTADSSHLADARQIVEPFASGAKSTSGDRVSGSVISGHLVFSELARMTGDKRYQQLVIKAADQGFDAQGKPLPAVPSHSEMSDAVFMACPILAEAGALTGDNKYFEQCLRHLRFMRKLCVREDGIYRHSPLDETAWGRGNGFPALGLAWSLSVIPKSFDGRPEVLTAFQEHLEALLRHQDPNGMWHQVIDHPESYREMTSTCMITYAMIRGVRNGWLPRETYEPAITKAWRAIKTRLAPTGEIVDVCTGTGKQKNLRAYFDRTAILGKDERGGAMALMVATEMAAYTK